MRSSKKKALLVTLALVLTAVLLLTAFCEAYLRYPVYYYQDATVRQELAGTLDTLIVGSSHGFRAFIPQVLDEILGTSSYNLSGAMMTMQGRHELLKKELARNPVKTVIFELSFNALSRIREEDGPEGELYLLGRLDSTKERISYFFRAIPPSEYTEVLHDTFTRSKTAWGMLLKGEVSEPQLKAGRGFLPEPTTDLSQSFNDAWESWHDGFVMENVEEENLDYLKKSVQLCQQKGIRVIFAVTPMADQTILGYSNLEVIRQKELELARELGVEFYDFNLLCSRSDYPADTAFFDETHLSGSGAETFSRYFAEFLQKVDAHEPIDDLFYRTYTEAGYMILSCLHAAEEAGN